MKPNIELAILRYHDEAAAQVIAELLDVLS
jgi:hypothetical protein